VRTFATRAVPDTVGDAVFVGANNAATAAVDADHFDTDPIAFVAVTAATTNLLASNDVNVYVDAVAPEIGEHTDGAAFAAT
jgi:hypothetical protein